MAKPLRVFCPHCLKLLGRFNAQDDNGGVDMECQHCKKMVALSNQALMYPKDWRQNGKLFADTIPEEG